MKTIERLKRQIIIPALISCVALASCEKDDEDPHDEHEHEVITDVKLVFTNESDATDVVEALAQDPDGEGVEPMTIVTDIALDTNKTYTLTIEIVNNLESPANDVAAEVKEEDEEHQFFFSFTNNAFTNPTGSGNVGDGTSAIVYNDEDANGNPLGLSTTWTTGSTTTSNGTFRVVLMHQPGVKTATSGTLDGDADFNIEFGLNID